ncbi:MAG: hypothetical protein QGG64_19250, partial [Candidatus Latescibacteria bacterium]|nr:hypothetical protein [Candidatus Latescibacterota bacterium]
NWSHDHPKGSFRFDSGSFPKFSNAYGEMSYNVARNTPAGYRLKGDDHLFHNNILMGSAKQDSVELDAQGGKAAASVVLFNMERWASENKRTLVANNAVTEFWSGDRKNGTVLSVMKSNVTGKFRTHLRDPANLDFRPRKDSPLVDKGYSITKEDVAWKTVPITGKENHIGKPDIGAYEYGAKYYWIPGFQYPYASTPVPPNNTKTAKNGCDLMYLAGYKAQKHIVYFGTAPDELKQVDDHNNDVNIYSPGKLESGKTYYWRVDAIRDGKTIQGELWRFRTE